MHICIHMYVVLVVKNLPANAWDLRDAGSILGTGASPGGGHGSPLQYFCLENPRREEPEGLQSTGFQSPIQLMRLSTYAYVYVCMCVCVCVCVYIHIYSKDTASLENHNTNFKKCGTIGYITECQLKCRQESWGKQLRVRSLPPSFAETSSSLCLFHSPSFSRDADRWSSSSQLQWKKIQTENKNRIQIQNRNTNFYFVQIQNRNWRFDSTEAVGLDGTAARCKPAVL